MQRAYVGIVLAALLVAGPCARAAQAADSIVSGTDAASAVTVVNVATDGGTVSGVLINGSARLVRDVRLLVHYTWLWKDERHPGEDNPGRAEPDMVPGPIPPGGRLRFTHAASPPLPQRSDGHFQISVDVVGFTEVGE
jgi:hypothetical protein